MKKKMSILFMIIGIVLLGKNVTRANAQIIDETGNTYSSYTSFVPIYYGDTNAVLTNVYYVDYEPFLDYYNMPGPDVYSNYPTKVVAEYKLGTVDAPIKQLTSWYHVLEGDYFEVKTTSSFSGIVEESVTETVDTMLRADIKAQFEYGFLVTETTLGAELETEINCLKTETYSQTNVQMESSSITFARTFSQECYTVYMLRGSFDVYANVVYEINYNREDVDQDEGYTSVIYTPVSYTMIDYYQNVYIREENIYCEISEYSYDASTRTYVNLNPKSGFTYTF